jgi:hypothetical protein
MHPPTAHASIAEQICPAEFLSEASRPSNPIAAFLSRTSHLDRLRRGKPEVQVAEAVPSTSFGCSRSGTFWFGGKLDQRRARRAVLLRQSPLHPCHEVQFRRWISQYFLVGLVQRVAQIPISSQPAA